MPPIIQVENLGKKYTLRHQGGARGGYRRLSEELLEAIKKPFRRSVKRASINGHASTELIGRPTQSSPLPDAGEGPEVRGGECNSREDFWALRDVSFEVNQGEVLGIIGRNGAGKSTLLKILSRITEPTEGRVSLRGRVASLLEVGTGFHPELTGRENIFLNGAVLGMSRAEIKRKFDEIVAFAEVDKFLDTPVKHYSSGMYVRLAFAVAAHLEPEILIVDEVLAVGDAAFQMKCLGKMKDVAGCGRTVLFVSHNMEAIKQLCEKAIILNHGNVIYAGQKLDAVKEYQNRLSHISSSVVTGSREVILTGLRITDANDKELHTFNTFDRVTFELHYKCHASINNASFALCFDDLTGARVTSLWSSFQNKYFDVDTDNFKCTYMVESIHLKPGVYSIVVYAESNGRVLEQIDNYAYITVGYLEKYGLVKVPELMHGSYTETFDILIT